MSIGKMIGFFVFIYFANFIHGESFSLSQNDGTLDCNSTSMKIYFNLTKLKLHNREFKIHFLNTTDMECQISHNATVNIDNETIWLNASYNQCGIAVYQRDGKIVYNQTVVVTYGNDPHSALVFREEHTHYNVECEKSNNFTVQLEGEYFNVTYLKKQIFHKAVNTTFDIELVRTTNGRFTTEDNSGQTFLGENMYFKIVMETVRNDLTVSPQDCYATNVANAAQRYYLIKNRCPNTEDKTIKFNTQLSTNNTFVWENQAFRFFGASDAVYISCDVLICTTSNSMSECQRCTSSPLKRRRRRDVRNNTFGDVESTTLRTPVFYLVEGENGEKLSREKQHQDEFVLVGVEGIIIIVLSVTLFLSLCFLIIKNFSR